MSHLSVQGNPFTEAETEALIDIAAGGGGGGHTIEDEGTPLTQRASLNFVGDGVSAADAGGKTVVTINGGSGGIQESLAIAYAVAL